MLLGDGGMMCDIAECGRVADVHEGGWIVVEDVSFVPDTVVTSVDAVSIPYHFCTEHAKPIKELVETLLELEE